MIKSSGILETIEKSDAGRSYPAFCAGGRAELNKAVKKNDDVDAVHIALMTAVERIENEEVKREVMFAMEEFIYALQDDVADMVEQSYEEAYRMIVDLQEENEELKTKYVDLVDSIGKLS